MICIFSTAVDQSTTDVIRWLHHLGERHVVRINADAPKDISFLEVSDTSLRFEVRGQRIRLEDIRAAWYRKGRHWLCDGFEQFPGGTANLRKALSRRLKAERETLSHFVHTLITSTTPTLGSPLYGSGNKLLTLLAARDVGLAIPNFKVTTAASRVTDRTWHRGAITKALSDGLYCFDFAEQRGFFTYTELAGSAHLRANESFPPSFVQRFIQKAYDVRVFILLKECYSMAILSQSDPQTAVDFRKYNDEVPNRAVPYTLPRRTAAQLRQLLRRLKLNTASVDLAVTPDETHYFLEVNPVGQFGMMSEACNYQLERRIARQLMQFARHD